MAMQPDQSEFFYFVVIGGGPGSGLFVYSPAPGTGTLVASIAGQAGTDQYGNTYPAGITSELPATGVLAQLFNGTLSFANPLLVHDASIGVPLAADHLVLQSGQVAGNNSSVLTLGGGFPAGFAAFTQIQSLSVPGYEILEPSGDTTGATDYANLNAILNGNNSSALLAPGAWYLKQPLAWGSYELAALGQGAVSVQPGSSWAGSSMLQPSSGAGVRNLRGYGGTNVRSANPATDFIAIPAGSVNPYVTDVRCDFMNGLIINPAAITTSMHAIIRGIRGTHNAGGINLSAAAKQVAEIELSGLDIQQCEVSPAVRLTNLDDIYGGTWNLATQGAAGVPTFHVRGDCATVLLGQLDIGVDTTVDNGVGVVTIEDFGGASPQDIALTGGTWQQGGVGAIISGGANKLRLHGIITKTNKGDGFQLTGTGAHIALSLCEGSVNGTGAGSGYDVNVTSTAHVGLFGFGYLSTTTLAGRNITVAGNHVTDDNPYNLTSAGNAPGGW